MAKIAPFEIGTIVTQDERDRMAAKLNELVAEVNSLTFVLEKLAPGAMVAETLRRSKS